MTGKSLLRGELAIHIEHRSSGELKLNDFSSPVDFLFFLSHPFLWESGGEGGGEALISVSACCGSVILLLE